MTCPFASVWRGSANTTREKSWLRELNDFLTTKVACQAKRDGTIHSGAPAR